ncbi:hypothetical protein ABZS71_33650 [Streptomyces sp. NPDC005393]|uniref:hypothetical protein n=1 Tax=Streptomyces sp. NPDC005393 TaxID=3157041 RepID=UPI0033A338D1
MASALPSHLLLYRTLLAGVVGVAECTLGVSPGSQRRLKEKAEAVAWNRRDPACGGWNAPSSYDDPEGWFEWWDSCITDEVEPPEPPEPPEPCMPSEYTDAQGRCWEIICTPSGKEVRRGCDEPPTKIKGVIIGIRFKQNGYSVRVDTQDGVQIQLLTAGKVKLIHLIRAMVNEVPLPAGDCKKVPTAFWEELPKATLAWKTTFYPVALVREPGHASEGTEMGA